MHQVGPEVFVMETAHTYVQTIKATSLAEAERIAKAYVQEHDAKLLSVKTARVYETEMDERNKGKTISGG